MNYNQILGKISEESRQKVSKEYHDIYKRSRQRKILMAPTIKLILC